jgi:hypothetical protein
VSAPAGEIVLAHHAIVAALPFVVPTMVITLLVVVMAVRDRRRGDDDPENDPGMGQQSSGEG